MPTIYSITASNRAGFKAKARYDIILRTLLDANHAMLPLAVLVIYSCACLWLIAAAWRGGDQRAQHSRLLSGVAIASLGALLHAVVLYRALFSDPQLALNTTDVASLMGLIIATMTIWTSWRQPRFAAIGGALMLCAGIAAALTDDGSRNFTTSQSGWELTAHIIIAIVAYSMIAVGAAFAAALFALDRRLRRHQPLGVMSTLPSVEALEAAMFHAISVGFALLTLTLFSGFIFVQDLMAQHLAHKVALSCLAWLILGILLIGRWRLGWRGRTASRWALSGFALLLLAYFGSKLILEVLLDRHWG